MLAALVAVAAAARVLIAWRLRPWQPLRFAGLRGPAPRRRRCRRCVGTGSGPITDLHGPAAAQVGDEHRGSAFAVAVDASTAGRRTGVASVVGVRETASARPDIGSHRRGRAEAVVGPDLVRGWIVHDTGHDPRLIVWDLPFDDDDTRRARIIDAERDAALAWERYRAAVPAGGPMPGDSVVDSAESEPTARHLTESDPALRDPFADDSSNRSGDSGSDLDDADPFGRDN